MYKIGVAKAVINFEEIDYGMLGYGQYQHRTTGTETPLHARALVIEHKDKKLAFINVEFCFPTIYLKHGILEKLNAEHPNLGYTKDNIMLTAQHTHSAPGGYTQHFVYNVVNPGFNEKVYDKYRDGIIEALVAAEQNKKNASIKHLVGEFDKAIPVCFNRSIKAYNKNPEVDIRVPRKKRHLAADRTMKLLRFDDENGEPIGACNWFGVHTTSVSNQYNRICADNKGYASQYFEDYLKSVYNKEGISIFAQDAAGDISPNFIWDRKSREYRGQFEDDYKSAAYNGQLQFEKAKEIFEAIPKIGKTIKGELDYISTFVDMTNITIEEKYTGGLKHQTTSDATIGMAFLEGTTDGQGASNVLGQAIKILFGSGRKVEVMAARMSKNSERQAAFLRYYSAHHPKTIVMNLSKGIVAGAKKPEKLILPDFVDPTVKFIKAASRLGEGQRTPWVPERLPVQIFVVGQLAIVGIPGEITTIAGQRLRKTVADVLQERGVTDVLLAPYANGFAGYITTYEEYRTQSYEGGHTIFGKWTLAAYQMKFEALAKELLKAEKDRQEIGVPPVIFDKKDIWTGKEQEDVPILLAASEEEIES